MTVNHRRPRRGGGRRRRPPDYLGRPEVYELRIMGRVLAIASEASALTPVAASAAVGPGRNSRSCAQLTGGRGGHPRSCDLQAPGHRLEAGHRRHGGHACRLPSAGAVWHHDAAAAAGGGFKYGNCFVVVGLVVRIAVLGERAGVCRSCFGCGCPRPSRPQTARILSAAHPSRISPPS